MLRVFSSIVANAVCVGGACSWCSMLWHREHDFTISLLYRAASNPQKRGKSGSQSVPAPGWVCSGCCNHAWLQLRASPCPWHTRMAFLCNPWEDSPFLIPLWCLSFIPIPILALCSDLSVFSLLLNHLGAAEDSQKSMCSACYNLFSGTHSLGVGTLCPCTGRCQIKIKHSQTPQLLRCRWIWGFTVTCRIGSSP